MNRSLKLLSMFMLLFASVGFAESKPEHLKKSASLLKQKDFKQGQLLIRWKNKASANSVTLMHNKLQVKVKQEFQYPEGLELVKLPEGTSVEKAISFYKNNPNVAYVEPDYIVHTQEQAADPDDARWAEQWALNNIGQSEGVVDADVNGPEMWEVSTGSRDVVIGVIDTGILYTHPDLKDNVWVNSEEIAGNGIDDDNNSYIDDMHGINAAKKNGDPLDDNNHGTHVSGIMGAVGGNGKGIVGINQKTSIVGCKFLDARGSGSSSDAIACMEYMVNLKTRPVNPVNLIAINNSWAGGGYSQAMADAIESLRDVGVLFIAAASNEGNDNDEVNTYPADYPIANIISVAASDHKDELASFSNYGLYSVHLAAPGVDILSTIVGDAYASYSGTSMAAPHVTGMAGLIQAANPELDWKGVKNLLISSGQPIAAAKGKTISGRRLRGASVDGTGALTCVDQKVFAVLEPQASNFMTQVGKHVDFSVMSINCAAPGNAPIMISSAADLELNDEGSGEDEISHDGIFSARWEATESGSFSFDLDGEKTIDVRVYDPATWHQYKSNVEIDYAYRTIEGTKLELRDDSVTEVKSPFPVLFAGDAGGFTSLYVSSNGTISLTETKPAGWTNMTLPLEGAQTFIAPFWDDLNPTHAGGVFYEVIGEAPNRELIVEWRQVEHFSSHDSLTFEVVFFENSSDILFNYADVLLGGAAYDKGASATIGVQTGAELALMYGYNEALLDNNTSLLFTKE